MRKPEAAVAARPESSLDTHAPGDIVKSLKALGLPPQVVRATLQAILYHRFEAAIADQKIPKDLPYWRPLPESKEGGLYLAQLANEIEQTVAAAMGDEAKALTELQQRELTRAYGNMAPETISETKRINAEYDEMLMKLRKDWPNGRLDALRLLESERDRDLRAAMTESEWIDYQARKGSSSGRLRNALDGIEIAETEYLAVVRAQQSAEDRTRFRNPTAENMLDARLAFHEADEQTLQTLGEDRFMRYKIASDNDFRRLSDFVQSRELPKDSLLKTWQARIDAEKAFMRILGDSSLVDTSKQGHLQAAYDKALLEIQSILGPEAGLKYANESSTQWTNRLRYIARPPTPGK